MKFSYDGHSCFGVEVGTKHLLFDLFIKLDHAAAQERFQTAGRVLHLLSPGDTREFR